ncbi:S9 family peptidase [candidate division KSB1 bacterium]|nr:S9 family peptidase [candidate division KSB1 bacterium]
MKLKLLSKLFLLVFILPNVTHAQPKIELDVKTIMQDPKTWVGSAPNNPFWSEDSKWIYFNWNPEAADSDSLYRVSANGGKPIKLSRDERLRLAPARGVYSRDYRTKLFSRSGDIFLYDIKRNSILQITNTSDRESNPKFTQDERGLIFQRGMNLYKWQRARGTTTQITDLKKSKKPEDDPEPKTDAEKFVKHDELDLIQIVRERKERRQRSREARQAENPDAPPKIYIESKDVQSPSLSPDGRFVTFRLVAKDKSKRTKVPDFVTETGFTKDLDARPKVGHPQRASQFAFYDLKEDTLIYIKPDSLPGIFDAPEFTRVEKQQKDSENDKPKKQEVRQTTFYGPYWSADGKQAFVVVRAMDHKDRWLAMLDLPSGNLTGFERQHDDAWIGGPNIGRRSGGGRVGWMPDNQRVWFCSEESGYSHLYVINPKTGAKKTLTEGDFEIYNPQISRDKKSWTFAANKVHPGERHFYRMPLEGGKWEKLTSMAGRNDAVVSPNGRKLVIRHSFMNKPPELYVQNARADSKAKQLTTSTTEDWRKYNWRVPEIVQIPARDGARPYARFYKPEKPNGAAVVFVHGAGYLQNAHKWWSGYFREYMFHNLLADKGYTVLDIDYRASAGYGRDWRTAIYRFMGGKDLDDQVDGAKWLVEEHGIDSKRIGIYGGSYGGFITFMAMFTAPDVFAAGASLRPVTDWAHYNHSYTSNILNIPQADTLAYRRSSPIYHAEGLKGHLLICHGMIDTNVHFQDTVRLVQRLIELGKENWEAAIYPLEGHGFREPSSWTDEYRRILKLFEETLN